MLPVMYCVPWTLVKAATASSAPCFCQENNISYEGFAFP